MYETLNNGPRQITRAYCNILQNVRLLTQFSTKQNDIGSLGLKRISFFLNVNGNMWPQFFAHDGPKFITVSKSYGIFGRYMIRWPLQGRLCTQG